MSDRNVRMLFPTVEHEPNNLRPYSSFAECPNIVLLGDPGAGKTYLFERASLHENGRLLKTRDFLNIPDFGDKAILFIDALDERRAGRRDHSTIDEVVRRLFQVKPAKVRISCRVSDWLGDTDLAAFNPYFQSRAGVAVLCLDALTEAERREVLHAQGANASEIDAFLNGAALRGLQEFLSNPQNLIMLWNAVKAGTWPASRKEMLELATDLLLEEINGAGSRSPHRAFNAQDLRFPAGAICAARLISDVDGISLAEIDIDANYPSFRGLSFIEPELTLAALGRRVFSSTGRADRVDYMHRIVAEFLGARWIAKQVADGMPLSRVQKLLGSDLCPAPGLRGLHAWLPVFMPEHADLFINTDPYGVLLYGDASSLKPMARKYLLSALTKLATTTDPYFRANNWQSPALASLSGEDLLIEFRDILAQKQAPFHLRSLVLDAIAAGPPLAGLRFELLEILKDHGSSYAERSSSLAALLRLGEDTIAEIVRLYRHELGSDADSLRLRAEILTSLYDRFFEPKDIKSLLNDTSLCQEQLVSGTFWQIPTVIRKADIVATLSLIFASTEIIGDHLQWANAWEIVTAIDRLLCRAIEEFGEEINVEMLLEWLRMRTDLQPEYAHEPTNIRKLLVNRPVLLRTLVDVFIGKLNAGCDCWLEISRLDRITLQTIPRIDLERWVFECFENSSCLSAFKRTVLYELSLILTLQVGSSARDDFERLCTIASYDPEIEAIRDQLLVSSLRESTLEYHKKRIESKRERSLESARVVGEFAAALPKVRSGEELGWLGWAAMIYFGIFNDVDSDAPPRQRLVNVVGEENAEAAIEGFLSLLQRNDKYGSLCIEEIAPLEIKRWWLGLLAGMDELWGQTRQASCSDKLLVSLLAIEIRASCYQLTNPLILDEPESAGESLASV